MTGLGFGGEVAELYRQYRQGYPPAVFDALMSACGLTADDTVLDIGCGTGQLTLSIAARVRAVVGLDPEPDMLVQARHAAAEQGVPNATWLLGADTDVPALVPLLGRGALGAVTVGQALHWMDHVALFQAVAPLIRTGGGLAVVTNGTPMWLQDSAWSRALRDCLQDWLGIELTDACGTDQSSQRRYRDALTAAGFDVRAVTVDHVAEMDLDELVGAVLTAFPVDKLPGPDQRPIFAERVRRALYPQTRFEEPTRVTILVGRA